MSCAFGPDPRGAWLRALAGVLLLVLALPGVGLLDGVDAGGRVLLLPTAVLVAGWGARDLLLRPVLSAEPEGVELLVGLRRRRVRWAALEGLRVVTDRRTPLLELDLGDTLVVLSRSRLGALPVEVLEQLEAVRAGS